MTILLLFFCSGVTGLVYEVLWSKYLALLFGSTIQAQTVVLAIFMGGLALGNRLVGRRADTLRGPLAVYGYLEGSIGLYAFFFPWVYRLADQLFAITGSGLLDRPALLVGVKGLLSAALLLGPTIAMGGTLPLLAAWLQKSTLDAGRRSAIFYSINCLGAVCGAGLAGFFLVTRFGMTSSLQLAALVNVLIGLTALGIARSPARRWNPATAAQPASVPAATFPEASRGLFGWACLLVTLTGAVSMGLEVLASRCLSLLFGASLQAFAIVLMAFILGIGLGSAVIAGRGGKGWPREVTTIGLVLGAAVWIGLLVFNIESLTGLYVRARSGLNANPIGYRYDQFLAAVFSMFILGVPAAALGAVLPLWIRAVSTNSQLLGDRVGRLLTWNTLGAVGGVLLTGFVLMPRLGLRGSFAALAVALCGVALFVAWAHRRRVAMVTAAAASGLLLWIAVTGGEHWRMVLNSGVFRLRGAELSVNFLEHWGQSRRILFYEDAPDATVSVEEESVPGGRNLGLRINGKPDASTHGDLSTQVLCAHLPLMVKPESKEVFVFGLGSGVTAGAALNYPIKHLTIAENCAPVVRAARFFEPWNNGVLADPRAHICDEDARTVLKLSRQKYDVIIAEPSNPWTVGIGSVFSREFYELANHRLKPGGIMVQWFHVYEMNDGIVSLVIRTFGSVFPAMEIWDASDGDILLVGSQQPWPSGPEVFARVFRCKQTRRDLEKIGLGSPDAVLARQLASQNTAFAVAGPGPMQTDEFPVLEYAAPEAFFIGQPARVLGRFDERTWQSDIAPTQKRHVLARLDRSSLESVFGGIYRSVNPDVQAFVERRLSAAKGAVFNRLGAGLIPPCVFDGTNSIALAPPPLAATNSLARQLFEAESALVSSDMQPSPALDAIESILMSAPRPAAGAADWHPEYYACLAAKARLRQGQPARARQVLLRGLKLAPESEQLAFLARVMLHEGTLQLRDVRVAMAVR